MAVDMKLLRKVIIDVICLAVVFGLLPMIAKQLIPFPQNGFYCDDMTIRYPYKDSSLPLGKIAFGALGYFLPILSLAESYKRGFYCDDDSIRYPYKDSTVTTAVLDVFGLGLPILSMICVELVRWRANRESKRTSSQNQCGILKLGSWEIPSVAAESFHLIAIFLFGAACSQLTTDIGKYTIGRLRPHFLDVCRPDLEKYCSGDPHAYILDFQCSPDADPTKLKDSRLSFPSGHSSFSAYTMLFLVFYLQRRMNWSGANLIRPTYQIALLMLAWYTGLSRVSDYKHHWSDVLSGFLIGTIAATLTALYISRLFQSPSRLNQPLLPVHQNRNNEEIGMDNVQYNDSPVSSQ